MAEATINAGPYGVGTKRVMRETLDAKAAGAAGWDRLRRAAAGARNWVVQAVNSDLANRALGFIKARIDWARGFINDVGPGRVAAYAASTIEGRQGIRKLLAFGWKLVAFPFKLVGKPVSWVLRHTGRPGIWVYNTALIAFCWTRDKVKSGYDTAEAWLEAHDDVWWMRWARGWLHWQIVSRIVDRLAPAWMPRWLRFIIKAGIPGFTYRKADKSAADYTTAAGQVFEFVAEGYDKVNDGLDRLIDVVEDLGVAAEADAGLKETSLREVRLRDTRSGRKLRAQVLTNGADVYVKLEGTNQFVAGGIPTGYEEVTLTETAAADPVDEPDVPVPANREAKREAEREARRTEAKAHGPAPKPGPVPGPAPA